MVIELAPNLGPLAAFVRHSSILCRSSPATYARLVARTSGEVMLPRTPSRDRRSSRAHVRTNAARARTCRAGVVSASIRRIQFLKGNHRRPLWGMKRRCRGRGRTAGVPSVRRPSPGRAATSETHRNRPFVGRTNWRGQPIEVIRRHSVIVAIGNL